MNQDFKSKDIYYGLYYSILMKESLQKCIYDLNNLVTISLQQKNLEQCCPSSISREYAKSIKDSIYNQFLQQLKRQNAKHKQCSDSSFLENIQKVVKQRLRQQDLHDGNIQRKRGRPVKNIHEEIQLAQWIRKQKRNVFTKAQIRRQFQIIRGKRVTAFTTATIMRILDRSGIEGLQIKTKCVGRKIKSRMPSNQSKQQSESIPCQKQVIKKESSIKLLQSPQSQYISIEIQLSSDQNNIINKYLNKNQCGNNAKKQENQQKQGWQIDRNLAFNEGRLQQFV